MNRLGERGRLDRRWWTNCAGATPARPATEYENMNRLMTRVIGWMTIGAFVLYITGCSQNEHKEVKVKEEQKQGPVEDTSPGEMVVE